MRRCGEWRVRSGTCGVARGRRKGEGRKGEVARGKVAEVDVKGEVAREK